MDAAEDRWLFWTLQVALFSLMTAAITTLILGLGKQMLPPGTGGLGLIVTRMASFAVLFGVLAWTYTRPWFQRLSGAAFGAGVAGACIAIALLDMAVFPLVLNATQPHFLFNALSALAGLPARPRRSGGGDHGARRLPTVQSRPYR
jgi:hypothetical protein